MLIAYCIYIPAESFWSGDTNLNGKVDAQYTAFADLRIWKTNGKVIITSYFDKYVLQSDFQVEQIRFTPLRVTSALAKYVSDRVTNKI